MLLQLFLFILKIQHKSFLNNFRVSPDQGAANYINNYDGGTTNEYYWMRSGGDSTSPTTNESGTYLNIANNSSSPGFSKGAITNLTTTISDNKLISTWQSIDSLSPQFSYHIAIYEHPDFIGQPLLQKELIKPHARIDTLDIVSLNKNQEYFVKFYITDIFDQDSDINTSSFVNLTSSIDNTLLESYSVLPNPSEEKIDLKFNKLYSSLTLSIYNIQGALIFSKRYENIKDVSIPFNGLPGVYILSIKTKNGNKVQKLLIKK